MKWIVAQPYFTELRRLSRAENKIYTLYTNQYNEILKTGETPNNLQIAQKFVANGYDVFLLANPHNTKSADFIIRQKNKLFYVEGKTSSGGSALSVRLREGAQQSEIIAVNFSNYPKFHELLTFIKRAFEGNSTLRAIVLFKKARMITISCKLLKAPNGENIFYKVWNLKK